MSKWQNHQCKRIVKSHRPHSPPPFQPLSSAKPYRDLFMMSRITGKPPISSQRAAAPRRPVAPACLFLPINTPQNAMLLANHPLKEQTNSDVRAHYL